MASTSEWLQLLRRVFLFSSFTGSQLSLLAKKMTLVSYPKGAVLFHENDPGDSLYLILSGSVRILQSSEDRPGEEDKVLAYLSRGDALGEMALLASEPRTHTAIVDSTAELLVLTKHDFDQLLEKVPALAVHLSRILSSRLASVHRSGGIMAQPSRIFTALLALPDADQVVFAVNLAMSLAEQTRRRVLLCAVDEGSHRIARSLGFEPAPLSDAAIRAGALNDIRRFDEHVLVHPSGLELLEIEGRFLGNAVDRIYSFFALVKDRYDICLIALPSRINGNAHVLLRDSDRVVLVAGPQSDTESLSRALAVERSAEGKKAEKVWLSGRPDSSPAEFFPDVRLDWEAEWARRFEMGADPYLPADAVAGHRTMDRLARRLCHLTIGFAMGSGAAFGYALIGMLRVLEREGIFPDVIAGTSMGALIGAFYARGITPDELEQIACSVDRKRLWSMADPILPRTGLIRGAGVLRFLKSHLGERTFRDLLLPFSCVATDIQTGKEIVLDRGNVAEAVRASLSLPFFFQPFYLDGRYLVDGGLVNPVPTSIIVSEGANILISANLTSKANERRVPKMIGWWRRRLPSILRGPSIPETMIKTIYIMQYEIAQARSELAHVVMEIKHLDLLWWDLDRAREMIKMGEASAEEAVPKIKTLLPFFADSCKVRIRRKGRKGY